MRLILSGGARCIRWVSVKFHIETADVRSQTSASIVGVLRDGELVPNPALTYRFAAGDLVAVMGSGDQLASFQALTADNIGPVDAFDMANSTI